MSKDVLAQYDHWVEDGSDVAALVMRQVLESPEGRDAVIFPPTFAAPEGIPGSGWTGYNIDRLRDETSVCLIDSVGSQSNRMEPVFKLPTHQHLVPQITVEMQDSRVHILDVGHRAADAAVRFAGAPLDDPHGRTLGEELWEAFTAWNSRGDADPLVRVAPTTCVFGAWDSRATHARFPRIVRSVIRAYDVDVLTRSAQYIAPVRYVNEGVLDEKHDSGAGTGNPLSQEGFNDNPATNSHGGILVNGQIRRDALVNLAALRSLGVDREDPGWEERELELRRYVLGLALVALTRRDDRVFNLREGCLLRVAQPTEWRATLFEGDDVGVNITEESTMEYATVAAQQYGVSQVPRCHVFDRQRANDWLGSSRDQRDRQRRQGPRVTGAQG